MLTPVTELLELPAGPGRPARLVPVLCGLAVGGSWLTLLGFLAAYVPA